MYTAAKDNGRPLVFDAVALNLRGTGENPEGQGLGGPSVNFDVGQEVPSVARRLWEEYIPIHKIVHPPCPSGYDDCPFDWKCVMLRRRPSCLPRRTTATGTMKDI